jgi:hypothetical protein
LYLDSIGSESLRFHLIPHIGRSVAQDHASTEILASLWRRQIHGSHSMEPREAAGSDEFIFLKNRKPLCGLLASQAAGDAFLNGS